MFLERRSAQAFSLDPAVSNLSSGDEPWKALHFFGAADVHQMAASQMYGLYLLGDGKADKAQQAKPAAQGAGTGAHPA